jgi:hypothetical protein
METEHRTPQSSPLTQEEILELRQRVFQFEEKQSKARAPIRYAFIGCYLFAAGIGIFVLPFFPSIASDVTRVLLWGLMGVAAVICVFAWHGKVVRNREGKRIYDEIYHRQQR